MKTLVNCRHCDGYGYNEIEPEVHEEQCTHCGGSGKVEQRKLTVMEKTMGDDFGQFFHTNMEPTFREEDDEYWAGVEAHEEQNSKHYYENK